MSKIIHKDYQDEKKCGCGYRFTRLYAFDGDEKEFEEVGLCGLCFTEMLEESGYDIFQPGVCT